jgi:hypothetical protein
MDQEIVRRNRQHAGGCLKSRRRSVLCKYTHKDEAKTDRMKNIESRNKINHKTKRKKKIDIEIDAVRGKCRQQ